MKTSILIFLSSILFILSSCQKKDLFVSCDNSAFSLDEIKNKLIGKWQQTGYCEDGKIISVDNNIIWEYAETYNNIQTADTRQLHLIETTNNIQTKNDTIELLKADYTQFTYEIEHVIRPKRLDVCDNEFTLKLIDGQGKTYWVRYFERIQ